MLRVKQLQNREYCIIDEGKVYLFNLAGNCYKEDEHLLPKYTSGMLDLPIISILSSGGVVEIATFDSDVMHTYYTELDLMNCTMQLQSAGDFVKVLRRNGKSHDVAYNQLILVYKAGTDLLSKLDNLKVKEIV